MCETTTVQVEGREHLVGSGERRLFLWQKLPMTTIRGVVVCVHGSSASSLPQFDLQVSGRPEASLMNWLASRGYEVWCFDCRGYGRSYKGDEIWATCEDGAEDIQNVVSYVVEHSIANKVFLYGGSAGALRAAIFASRYPQRILGLVLEGLVWTGEGSPTLAQRRSKLDLWLASSRRPIDGSFIATIMSRDGVASADPELAQAFSQQVLDRDESMPTGTYIDMCSRLPIVDPGEIRVPTLIIRGQYDGVASEMDVLGFFNRLGASAKYLDVLEGIAHATLLQKNAPLVYHSLLTFLLRPASLFVADMPVTEQKQSLPVAQLAERFR